MRTIVFGWGNELRGDDGIGPLLLRRLEKAGWDDTELIEDFQLQIEHALDLKGAELALFLDAGVGAKAPFLFREILPRGEMIDTSHGSRPNPFSTFSGGSKRLRRRRASCSVCAAKVSGLAKVCRNRAPNGSSKPASFSIGLAGAERRTPGAARFRDDRRSSCSSSSPYPALSSWSTSAFNRARSPS